MPHPSGGHQGVPSHRLEAVPADSSPAIAPGPAPRSPLPGLTSLSSALPPRAPRPLPRPLPRPRPRPRSPVPKPPRKPPRAAPGPPAAPASSAICYNTRERHLSPGTTAPGEMAARRGDGAGPAPDRPGTAAREPAAAPMVADGADAAPPPDRPTTITAALRDLRVEGRGAAPPAIYTQSGLARAPPAPPAPRAECWTRRRGRGGTGRRRPCACAGSAWYKRRARGGGRSV